MLPIDPGDGQGRYLPAGRWPPAPPEGAPDDGQSRHGTGPRGLSRAASARRHPAEAAERHRARPGDGARRHDHPARRGRLGRPAGPARQRLLLGRVDRANPRLGHRRPRPAARPAGRARGHPAVGAAAGPATPVHRRHRGPAAAGQLRRDRADFVPCFTSVQRLTSLGGRRRAGPARRGPARGVPVRRQRTAVAARGRRPGRAARGGPGGGLASGCRPGSAWPSTPTARPASRSTRSPSATWPGSTEPRRGTATIGASATPRPSRSPCSTRRGPGCGGCASSAPPPAPGCRSPTGARAWSSRSPSTTRPASPPTGPSSAR